MRLGKHDRCPIHKRFNCCGRESQVVTKKESPKRIQIGPGVFKIPDVNHPRGYRIYRTPAAMRALLDQKIIKQNAICAICNTEMTDYRNVAPDHIEPKGIGSSRKDDHEDNIQAVHHYPCNIEKGSRRI